jgi:hypothetical protein
MAKQTFRLTIDVEVDPDEITNDVFNGSPEHWNWQGISKVVDIPGVVVSVKDSFIACCDEKVEWQAGQIACESWALGEFKTWDHDESCVNFVPIDDGDGDE